jgi:hypothetical protein
MSSATASASFRPRLEGYGEDSIAAHFNSSYVRSGEAFNIERDGYWFVSQNLHQQAATRQHLLQESFVVNTADQLAVSDHPCVPYLCVFIHSPLYGYLRQGSYRPWKENARERAVFVKSYYKPNIWQIRVNGEILRNPVGGVIFRFVVLPHPLFLRGSRRRQTDYKPTH